MLHNSKLEAKVAAVNFVHEHANKLYDQLAPIIKEFVGQKIYKADGDLMAKFASRLPDSSFPALPSFQVYRYRSDYSLVFMVKTCQQYKFYDEYYGREIEGVEYYEIGVYMGEVNNGILAKLNDRPNHKCDYNAKEIEQQRKEAKSAKEAYEKAKEGLYVFGEA